MSSIHEKIMDTLLLITQFQHPKDFNFLTMKLAKTMAFPKFICRFLNLSIQDFNCDTLNTFNICIYQGHMLQDIGSFAKLRSSHVPVTLHLQINHILENDKRYINNSFFIKKNLFLKKKTVRFTMK